VLTQRQLQLLQFIQRFMEEHGVPPSFEEMRTALKLKSKSGIHRLLAGLVERGYINRMPYRARALEILRPVAPPRAPQPKPALAAKSPTSLPANVVRPDFGVARRPATLAGVPGNTDLPVYGRIAAGTPVEALSDNSSTVDVPSMLIGDGDHYILQVVGDSMTDAGIHDGDWVIIKYGETAETGDIVVALIEDREVTLKRLRRRGASIALEPANPNYKTRIFGPHEIKVQGKLVGLMRRY
jgi:repressor LexA